MGDTGPRVLIVDDELAIRRFLRASLPAQGYQIFEAESGEQALRAVATQRPDLIILDLGLPDLDGVEVTRRVREWSKVPVLILSVRGHEDEKIAALDAGADDYLTKPFSMGELLARMRVATVEVLSKRFQEDLAAVSKRLPPSINGDDLARAMATMVSVGTDYAKASAEQKWSRAGQLGPEFTRSAAAIEWYLEDAQRAERSWVEDRLVEVSAELRRRALYFGGGIGGCLLLAALLTWSLQRRLVKPLATLKAATARIVEHGDLAQTISIRSNDEIGELASSFARMVEKLREIPNSLDEASQVLAKSVGALGVTATEQRDSILRQATALDETQVTANEIRQTSAAAAQKAEHVLQVVARADEVSRSGEESLERSLSGLSEIGSTVVTMAEKIELLKERMRQIDAINITVKDLADQSNMLALNAAIEAVRSGEHGKGFAVVAREIRSLADQSIQATARVREILLDISRSIDDAVKISAAGRKRTESGLAEVRTAGETMRALSAMVKDTSDAVRQITASVSQQNAGISQIFTAVSDLSEGMRDTRTRLDSTGEAIDRIQSVTDRVSQIVTTYRT